MVVIPTFDRPEELALLLSDIKDQEVVVYDDGSRETYPHFPGVEYHKLFHHGKKQYWKLVRRIFNDCRGRKFDYLFFLADDLRLKDGFFEKAMSMWEAIDDPDKACLNLLQDQRKGQMQWTKFTPVKMGDIWLTQWVDMCFLMPRSTLELLSYKVNEIPQSHWDGWSRRSSGVGRQISRRLYGMKKNIYQVDESLVIHDGSKPSKMHPAPKGQPSNRSIAV